MRLEPLDVLPQVDRQRLRDVVERLGLGRLLIRVLPRKHIGPLGSAGGGRAVGRSEVVDRGSVSLSGT
eukprot:1890867-Prymnesium_polylepis.1